MSEGTTERGRTMMPAKAAIGTADGAEQAPTAGLEQLFVEHHHRVYRAAFRVTGNAGDAEDVLQTVFLRLARQGTQGVEHAEAYLTRAAVNAALDLVRMRRDTRMVPVDAAPALADDPRRQPERSLQSRELRDVVRRAVATLPPRAAEIFALRYFEEYGNKEIAAMLGISQTDVAVTLHRSRSRLQDEIRASAGDTL